MRLLALVVLLSALIAPQTASAADCTFVLGFKTIHDAIPQLVGDCLVNEHHGANGDGLQETAGPTGQGGLLVWRKLDNWTAYTDGYRSWVNGPAGLQQRLNTQRFAWEANPEGLPVVGGGPVVTAPPVAPIPASPPGATASISDPSPHRNERVTVAGRLVDASGNGIAGVPMTATWHYKTTNSQCTGVTDSDGRASCVRDISSATVGYQVTVDVVFVYNGTTYSAQTSFTPQ